MMKPLHTLHTWATHCWYFNFIHAHTPRARARIAILTIVAALLCVNTTQSLAGSFAPNTREATLTPADIMVELQRLHQELEKLRLYVGKPPAKTLNAPVNNAAPHDVFFQAETLFQKVNHLSYDITYRRGTPLKITAHVYQLKDIQRLVSASHTVLDTILGKFNIIVAHTPIKKVPSTTPSDIFQMIMSINRQLNLMIRRPYEPSETYMQVTKAMGYMIRLLTPNLDATPIPEPPAFKTNKTPADVYFRLLLILEKIQKLYEMLSLSKLHIDTHNIQKANITSSDTFDLAALIVARLDYLYSWLGHQQEPVQAFYPGNKYPADVYQRSGILLNQLQQLSQYTTAAELLKSIGSRDP